MTNEEAVKEERLRLIKLFEEAKEDEEDACDYNELMDTLTINHTLNRCIVQIQQDMLKALDEKYKGDKK